MMNWILTATVGLLAFFITNQAPIYQYKINTIDGTSTNLNLGEYEGKVMLIVNVASKCGLTPQYKDLQALYEKYEDQGLVVLGFPANNFMGQEPGSNAKIKSFCTEKYNVTFPMFEKISVKGKDKHPLYQYLTIKDNNEQFNAPVQWNFQKFLVDRSGKLVTWYKPGKSVLDEEVEQEIKKLLES